ncbi:hypothetical protein [Hymenobacter metallicola]|uniref:DUF4369 domain-containing protein n=1 Tax=Hymenobacter metallicola TaxID=2563114 RepID=A0A4Z0QE04_9BACT|nr:hypothetical protein [Hymenobacter metallicola]TGE27914.1 hypothetical protein E5K02_00165 [Hymenobacter metallicola]
MRTFLLFAGLLFPQLVWAQFNSFEPGSYVLVDNPTQRLEGDLKLRGCTELLVKNAKGKTTRLSPEQVQSFRLGRQKFITAGGFPVDKGLDGDTIPNAFVEQLDSGQVVLMRLHYIVDGPMMLGTNGSPMGGGSKSYTLHLLRRAGESVITPLPASGLSNGGQKFRDALIPYLTTRPDLAKLVTNKLVNTDNLLVMIRALNTGQPCDCAISYTH